ncbi:hypothetical protein P4O66_019038 [Electrophorus voltai]|uniref:VLIG-type G domain-containing protein n=1 Tax=Electrophorus voltai TaxID=2609070 RepID=A0AAD8YR35_9TELE|nr:hypothetical protein P4O66_019038 [Electrophorus voltai]
MELMDGDAAHVPLVWVSAVLDELIKILGNQRVFVLSVLGIQSSGKSTMLNAMFGFQFAVSAGRCTRGAFMQLVKVSQEMKAELKFDYILVVDTEGLRALELDGKATIHHDNELATFVIGLGNLTLINIFGENPAEMQDILQIVVQAFLRMKKVRLIPSCMFVHQNVGDITAGEKTMEGRRRLQGKLDEMTKLAAKEEVCDAECFSDIIEFNVQTDVKYFAQLWEGSPPMAPPNPCYSENIQELKRNILSKISTNRVEQFTELHKKFKESSDVRGYLEKQRPQYFRVFKNYCSGATSTAVFGEFIVEKLEPSILQAAYDQTAIDLTEKMKCEVPAFSGNRSNLEKHILTSLAEEENFENYIEYIHKPKEHFNGFITKEVKNFIENSAEVIKTLKNNIQSKGKCVIDAVNEATVEDCGGNLDMWLQNLSIRLKDELQFKEQACVDQKEITDLGFLQEVVKKGLMDNMSKLSSSIQDVSVLKLKMFRKKPDQILIEHLCRCCWVQCPFCNAICTNTMEDHAGDHMVRFHRNCGINGWSFMFTNDLGVDFCTTAVSSSDLHFRTSAGVFAFKEYRKAGGEHARWNITADNSEMPYWKWFVCRFQEDLENHYKKRFMGHGEIPPEWKNYTKDAAIKSLRRVTKVRGKHSPSLIKMNRKQTQPPSFSTGTSDKMDDQVPNLTIVLCSSAVDFGDQNILLGQEQPPLEKADFPLIAPKPRMLVAKIMLSGYPLELMDGDAAHVPLMWVSAVLDELIKIMGDQRVFVLSVLGIQSSGKSTMLNVMFGLQFAVSAGRCTRGAFMQLVKVSEEMKEELTFDCILVVDTEGLRSIEHAETSTRHHDNKLATFVIGLGNMTLVNIFGENPAEMQDILQIVVQALLRMKKVRLNPSCMFVHQNVGDISAGEKNMEGRRCLQEKLDEMTKLAAKEEDSEAKCFSDVITFSVQEDVMYFAQLWEGSPPMAPPNPYYSGNIQELKGNILSKMSASYVWKLSQFKSHISNLWNAILNENFVFSFRNTLEVAAYRKLEHEYSKWTWRLRSAMLAIENKLHNRVINNFSLKVEEIKETKTGVEKSIKNIFDEDQDKEILIQWQERFEKKIEGLHYDLVKETKRRLDEVTQLKLAREKVDCEKSNNENELFKLSKELAYSMKNKGMDEDDLKKEFENVWSNWVMKLTQNTPSLGDIDFWTDVTRAISETYELHFVCERQNQAVYKNIDTIGYYTDYIILSKNQEICQENPQSTVKHIQEDEIKITVNVHDYTVKCDMYGPSEENCRTSTLREVNSSLSLLTERIIKEAKQEIQRKPIVERGYNHIYIPEIIASMCVPLLLTNLLAYTRNSRKTMM